jgi:hexosaminidase
MRLLRFLAPALALLLAACTAQDSPRTPRADLAVSWELLSNDVANGAQFEARFVLRNTGEDPLDAKNWALFFNASPRAIVAHPTPQPGTVRHLNGDWYQLVPARSFALAPGDSVEIRYRGSDFVIKETDAPLGLYVVRYDDAGAERSATPVAEYAIRPFTRPEQIRRGANEALPLPTPAQAFAEAADLRLLPARELLPVIPSPARLALGTDTLRLDNRLTIAAEPGLQTEARYLADRLRTLTGTAFTVADARPDSRGIVLRRKPLTVNGTSREAYQLRIDGAGVAITGSDSAGVFYGIQSLLSLVPPAAYRTPLRALPVPTGQVDDAPRFPFRSLHVDVGRNFQTTETIRRVIDLLAQYKLNHLLLYMTEDEGWRLEIPGLPELTEVGAARRHTRRKEDAVLHPSYGSGPDANAEGTYGGGFYTRQEFIDLLRYATDRHVTIIPEVNFPGHARAAIKAMEARYQRLTREGKSQEAEQYRLIDPDDRSEYLSAQAYTDNVVSVTRESTYRFYEKVVDELRAMYRDAGLTLRTMHVGGDEVPEGAWTKSPMAAKLLRANPGIGDAHNLRVYFYQQLLPRLRQRGLDVHGWEEIALIKNAAGQYQPNPAFAGQGVVPYIWNSLDANAALGYQLANAGYPVVLCNVSNFYLDMAVNNHPQEAGLYWGGFISNREAWEFEPFNFYRSVRQTAMGKPVTPAALTPLRPDARRNIRGLEAQLWGETVKGRAMLESYLLPRLAGFAECAWAAPRPWETLPLGTAREQSLNDGWNRFANTLAQRELPRLAGLNGGYAYRIPPPGAVVEGGLLRANAEFPGLTIRYTTDGTEPTPQSAVYTAPVRLSGPARLATFDAANRRSRVVQAEAGIGN